MIVFTILKSALDGEVEAGRISLKTFRREFSSRSACESVLYKTEKSFESQIRLEESEENLEKYSSSLKNPERLRLV